MTSVVRPCMAEARAACTMRSLFASKALVASSRISTGGSGTVQFYIDGSNPTVAQTAQLAAETVSQATSQEILVQRLERGGAGLTAPAVFSCDPLTTGGRYTPAADLELRIEIFAAVPPPRTVDVSGLDGTQGIITHVMAVVDPKVWTPWLTTIAGARFD